MRDLGALGGNYSGALAINNAGQAVGFSGIGHPVYPGGPDIEHAFITGPNGAGMMDLNLLVDLPEGIILTNARDINNNGQVDRRRTGSGACRATRFFLQALPWSGSLRGEKR